jgi:hypothetical protein
MLSISVRLGATLSVAVALAAALSFSATSAMAEALPASHQTANTSKTVNTSRPTVAVGAAALHTRIITSATITYSCVKSPYSGIAAQECTYLSGSGGVINYLQGVFYNDGYVTLDNVHIELTGPLGYIANCPQINLAPGIYPTESPICQWTPNDLRAAGDYCSILWHENSPTNYIEYAEACEYNP